MVQLKKLFSKNFFLRTLSAVVLIPLVITLLYLGGYYANSFVLVLAIVMGLEWGQLIKERNSIRWQLFGVVYILPTILSFYWMINQESTVELLLPLLAIIWSTDIGAYLAGVTIGGPKILPVVSPKKTWAGLIGGVILAIIVGCYFEKAFYVSSSIAILAQVGDFFESWLKRYFGIKDSGLIIPGHGGILDRLDSFTFVAPMYVLLHIL